MFLFKLGYSLPELKSGKLFTVLSINLDVITSATWITLFGSGIYRYTTSVSQLATK